MKVAHGGITPVDPGAFMEDFATNPKYGALPGKEGSVVIHKSGEKVRRPERSAEAMLAQQEQKAGRKASPRLSEEEEKSGSFSKVIVKQVELQAGTLRFAVIAPPASSVQAEDARKPLPTILAISRGEQRHVARFFRALRAEQRGWQMLVPLRGPGTSPDFFEPAGVQLLQQFLQALLDESREAELTAFGVMSRVFHLVGISHGGAAAVALAAQAPELTGSLSMITGFLPQFCELQALRNMSHIHLYVGDSDEKGHQELLRGIKEDVKAAGGRAHMHLVRGASHFDIGDHIDLEDFWQRLELSR